MPVPPVLAVRADGGPEMGVGHLARGLALVQAWVDRHGAAVLVTRAAPSFWAERFLAEGCAIADPEGVSDKVDWWVVDGYHLGGAAQAPDGPLVLVIDDHDGTGTAGAGADLVVDQNLPADPTGYGRARAVLSGPRYALLRREMCEASAVSDVPDIAQRVVVVLGGSPSAKARSLGAEVASSSRLRHLDVHVLSGTDDVASALAGADLALAAAGTVSWELCCSGVPSVLVAVAPNQEPVAELLAKAGAAIRVIPEPTAVIEALCALAADPVLRTQMARVGRSLVDGLGARRVACRLRSELLALRDVTQADAPLIYEWNNDPVTRGASFSTQPIAWDSHVSWLLDRLARGSAAMYIAASPDGGDVGLVRFEGLEPGVVEIGVTVAPSRRGQGWGGALVEAGCRRWLEHRGPSRIHARIKEDNAGSIRSFVDADFDLAPTDNPDVLTYARTLDGTAGRV